MTRLQALLLPILTAASLGLLWGGAFAWISIADNQYLSQGLLYNASRVLLVNVWTGLAAGLVIGGALSLIDRLTRRRDRSDSRSCSAEPRHEAVWLAACLAFTLLAVGAHILAHEEIDPRIVAGIYGSAGVWLLLRALVRSGRLARRPLVDLIVRAALATTPIVVLVVAVFVTPDSLPLLSRPELLLAAALTFVVACVWLRTCDRGGEEILVPLRRMAGLAVLALLGPTLLVWALISPTREAERSTNVLLIGIDTLRLDRTSLAEGSPRETSPGLAALASDGTQFINAISQAPWTMPAFASVMTGLYPREHGAVSLNGELRPREITLAEQLREAGYETAAIVSHTFVDSEHGFGQGFDRFDERNVLGHDAVTSKQVTDQALQFLSSSRRRPFFLFLHYFDPHWTYLDHDGFHWADRYDGWLRDLDLDISGLRDRRHDLEEGDIDFLRNLYDEEIAFTDREIARLLDHLRETGLDQDTMILVVSDHGEEFMERGWLGHTISLHEEQVRVPLVVALPPGETQVAEVEGVVETRAIPATVLDYLGLGSDGDTGPASLLPLIRGQARESPTAMAFSEVWLPDRGIDRGLLMSSLRTDRWKLVRDTSRGREHLYDLVNDPLELEDLAAERPSGVEELPGLLDAWLAIMEEAGDDIPVGELTDEQLRKLKALGYVK